VELSTTDGLTGLANARAFYRRLEREMARSRRTAKPLSLLLLDLDGLKLINDRLGHNAGDRALRHLAIAMRREMRTVDFAARLGGDEFAVVAVDADSQSAQAFAERLRAAIATEDRASPAVTASIGVTTFHPSYHSTLNGQQFTQAADRALYDAKRAGRHRIAIGAAE
jgi:diguanylate cyclase (GGDEF)-like protein